MVLMGLVSPRCATATKAVRIASCSLWTAHDRASALLLVPHSIVTLLLCWLGIMACSCFAAAGRLSTTCLGKMRRLVPDLSRSLCTAIPLAALVPTARHSARSTAKCSVTLTHAYNRTHLPCGAPAGGSGGCNPALPHAAQPRAPLGGGAAQGNTTSPPPPPQPWPCLKFLDSAAFVMDACRLPRLSLACSNWRPAGSPCE